ncbi:hypothetical protein D3C76_25520 [compost metagenome]
MRSLSITGGPRMPGPSSFFLLAVLVVVCFLHGCTTRVYQAVPQCEPTKPPKGEQYTKANPDEKLVQMTSAYIRQTQALTDCNSDIQLINAANKAVDR